MLAAVLALVFIAGLFGFAVAAEKGKSAGETPKIAIESKTIQLGEVLEGQDYRYTFKLKNTGAVEAQILNVRPG
jgi:hypothetical protein